MKNLQIMRLDLPTVSKSCRWYTDCDSRDTQYSEISYLKKPQHYLFIVTVLVN